jgi:hypothetical protein
MRQDKLFQGFDVVGQATQQRLLPPLLGRLTNNEIPATITL